MVLNQCILWVEFEQSFSWLGRMWQGCGKDVAKTWMSEVETVLWQTRVRMWQIVRRKHKDE